MDGRPDEARTRHRGSACHLAAPVAHIFIVGYKADDGFISSITPTTCAGHGLVYNVGERVEGYTNFLWVSCSPP
jgi:hypothetical protein